MAAASSRRPTRTPAQRGALLVFVLALVLAPALANIWPALGRGPMLYVGEPASSHPARAAGTAPSEHERTAHDAVSHRGHGAGGPDDAPPRHHDGDASAAGPAAAGVEHLNHDDRSAAAPDRAAAVDPPAADGHAARDAHAGHAQHCALCVLVAQAWAPQVLFDARLSEVAAPHRDRFAEPVVLRAASAWSGAHARAPPISC